MHHPVARPTFAPANLCARGVYEAPWFSSDRQSVLLAAVDSEGCMVGWAAVRDAASYAAESARLAALLEERDVVTRGGASASEGLRLVR